MIDARGTATGEGTPIAAGEATVGAAEDSAGRRSTGRPGNARRAKARRDARKEAQEADKLLEAEVFTLFTRPLATLHISGADADRLFVFELAVGAYGGGVPGELQRRIMNLDWSEKDVVLLLVGRAIRRGVRGEEEEDVDEAEEEDDDEAAVEEEFDPVLNNETGGSAR